MSVTIDGSTGITAPTYGGAVTAEYSVPVTGFKNRLINGGMVIDQRNAGASVSNIADSQYTLDRWTFQNNIGNKFSVQQNAGSVTPPAGFKNYLGITSSSAYSVAATDFCTLNQVIEGFNTADFAWGTSSAQTVTLSFWVRSSLTGTFGGTIGNANQDRNYPFTYTINSANTWEQKSITISGETTGSWNTTNGVGVRIRFGIGAGTTRSGTAGSWTSSLVLSATGATSVVGTSGATFYITGVQLEKGSTATSFDYRPYGTELALCQRYYYRLKPATDNVSIGNVQAYSATGTIGKFFDLPVEMRSAPTCNMSSPSDFSGWNASGANRFAFGNIGAFQPTTRSVGTIGGLYGASAGSFTAGYCVALVTQGTAGWIDASSEL
mgnify:FL=1